MSKSRILKIAIVAVLIIAVVVILQAKRSGVAPAGDSLAGSSATAEQQEGAETSEDNGSVEDAVQEPAAGDDVREPGQAATEKDTRTALQPENAAPVQVKKASFVALGADQCVPCKMMAPVRDELERKYSDKLKMVYHDVWKDPAPAEKYNIRSIPTNIILDGEGKEIHRHVGYWPLEDIISKLGELGIEL